MGLIDLITAIADAIRSKTGKEDKLTLGQMATEIESIQTGGNNQIDDIIAGKMIDVVSDVTNIAAYAFNYSNYLQSASFPNLVTVQVSSFGNCIKLASVYMPNVTSISYGGFNNCQSLTAFDFSKIETLGGNSFNKSKITEAILPNLTKFGSSGDFSSCINLAKVVIGKKVTIPNSTFGGCSALDTLILRGETKSTLSAVNAFTNTPIANGTGYIYVPKALLSDEDATKDYRRATNWITFAEQFRAIEDYPEICGG